MRVHPLWYAFRFLLVQIFWHWPTDSFAILLIRKECKASRFRLWLIDESSHDCCFSILNRVQYELMCCYNSWLAIKISVLCPLGPFTITKRWKVLSCFWFRCCSAVRCFHDFTVFYRLMIVVVFDIDYLLKFLNCAHCALLLLLKVEKYCPVLDSVAVLLLDAFMMFRFLNWCLLVVFKLHYTY